MRTPSATVTVPSAGNPESATSRIVLTARGALSEFSGHTRPQEEAMRTSRSVALIRLLVVVGIFLVADTVAAQTPTATATPDPCPSAHCLNCGGICNCALAKPPACIGICGPSEGFCVNMGGVCGCPGVTTTPTPGLTATATPTVTPTPEPLDHFTCYKAKTSKGEVPFPGIPNPPGVSLIDQFGSSTVEVRKSIALCAPTNKLGEDPTAPAHSEHLKGYQIKRAKVALPTDLTVIDQFNPGGLHLDAKKPTQLLVPTVKSLSGSPPLPPSFETDHFQCYKVAATKGAAKFVPVENVTIQDQFGSLEVTVKKPRAICNPVDKNAEDPSAPSHLAHLLCYQVKQTGPSRFGKRTGVYVRDQFGPERIDLTALTELCVPALKTP
jgi:hypothetical protein